jgi:hypothetical protein
VTPDTDDSTRSRPATGSVVAEESERAASASLGKGPAGFGRMGSDPTPVVRAEHGASSLSSSHAAFRRPDSDEPSDTFLTDEAVIDTLPAHVPDAPSPADGPASSPEMAEDLLTRDNEPVQADIDDEISVPESVPVSASSVASSSKASESPAKASAPRSESKDSAELASSAARSTVVAGQAASPEKKARLSLTDADLRALWQATAAADWTILESRATADACRAGGDWQAAEALLRAHAPQLA